MAGQAIQQRRLDNGAPQYDAFARVQEMARTAGFPAEWNVGDQERLLDAIRDTFHSLGEKADDLELPPFGTDQAALDFVKDKIRSQSGAVMRSTGGVAYGETGAERWKLVATTAAAVALGIGLPTTYASMTIPASWFYLFSLGRASTQMATVGVGMMCNPDNTMRSIKEFVTTRALPYGLPTVFYAIPQVAITVAHVLPENKTAAAVGEVAKAIIEHKAFLTTVGVVEFGIFFSANHPDKAAALWRKVRPWTTQESRFADGETMAVANKKTTKELRQYFKAGSALLGIYDKTEAEWVKNFGPLSDPLRQAMKVKRADLGQLAGTLEMVVGGIKTEPDADQGDQDQRGLVQRLVQAPVAAAMAAWTLPKTIREMSPEEQRKFAVVVTLAVFGAILGIVSSLAALTIPALLTDYIPYYLAAVIAVLLVLGVEALTASDGARLFGSFFGGTFIGLPFSIMNLISLFVWKEGFFDIVADGSVLGLPANATVTSGLPSLPLTKHPNIHGGDGRINFGVGLVVNILATLAWGGRIGDDIARKVIGALDAATTKTAAEEGDDDALAVRPSDQEEDDFQLFSDDEAGDDKKPGRDRRAGKAPGQEGSGDGQDDAALVDALTELKDVGKQIDRKDVDQIKKVHDLQTRTMTLAQSLQPEGWEFDSAEPPEGASDKDIERMKKLEKRWEETLKATLEANKAGASAG
jgi:hypothetical protein